MRRRALRWGLVAVVLGLGLGALGAASRTQARPMRPGLTPADLAPGDTIFFSHTPSAFRLYQDWLKGHLDSRRAPIVEEAMGHYATRGPGATDPRIATSPWIPTLTRVLGRVLATDLFVALRGAQETPGGGLELLMGARLPLRTVTGLGVRAALAFEVPGLHWERTRGGGLDYHRGTARDRPALYYLEWGDWVLGATSESLLLDTIARGLGRPAAPAPLRSTRAYQATAREQPGPFLFLLHTDVPRLAGHLRHGPGGPPQEFGRRLAELAPYLESVSWSWSVDSAANIGRDRFTYGLAPAAAARLRAELPPVQGRTRRLATDHTLVYAAFALPLASVGGTDGLFASTALARELRPWVRLLAGDRLEPEAAYVLDAPGRAEPPLACWALAHRDGAGLRRRLDALARSPRLPGLPGHVLVAAAGEPDTFVLRRAGREDALLHARALDDLLLVGRDVASLRHFAAAGGRPMTAREPFATLQRSFPSPGRPLLEIDYDTHAIVERVQDHGRRRWPEIALTLRARGMPVPDPAPAHDFSAWYGGAILKVLPSDGGVRVQHDIRRGASLSTGFTALGALGARYFARDFVRLEHRVAAWMRPPGASPPSGDAPGEFLWRQVVPSCVLFSPTFQGCVSLLTDLTTFVLLAQQPVAP